MPYRYTSTEREESPTLLPDIETFSDRIAECECGESPALFLLDSDGTSRCGECGAALRITERIGWWYAELDGGLDCWSSDLPSGPFATEAEALADARSFAAED